jgi:predicted nucleotidyltransferase
MFSAPKSLSDDLSLNSVMQRLQRHHQVYGIILIGSGAHGTLKSESDYDILLFVTDMPAGLDVLLTTVDGRLTDVLFYDIQTLENLLEQTKLVSNSLQGVILSWIQQGAIFYDPTTMLEQTKSRQIETPFHATPSELFSLWNRVNFNLAHGERMLKSNDDVYLQAMDLRFLYMLDEVLQAFMLTHQIPQRGEKHTIRVMHANYPDDLDLYMKTLRTADRQEKFRYYTQFAERALAPIGGLWDSPKITGFNRHPQDDYFNFWCKLLDIQEDLCGK